MTELLSTLLRIVSMDTATLKTTVLVLVILLAYQLVKDPEKGKLLKLQKSIPKRFMRNKKVQSMLKELIADTGAHRAAVYQFHNGGKSLMGTDFVRYSCTYEESAGIDCIQNDIQNRHISELTFWDINIELNHCITITNQIDIFSRDRRIHKYMVDNNIQQIFMHALYKNKKPIGLLEINYKDSRCVPIDTVDLLEKCAIKVSVVIDE